MKHRRNGGFKKNAAFRHCEERSDEAISLLRGPGLLRSLAMTANGKKSLPLILRSGVFAASRRMRCTSSWFETAQERLLTMRA
jgi:hypothetical protein